MMKEIKDRQNSKNNRNFVTRLQIQQNNAMLRYFTHRFYYIYSGS